VASGTNGYTVWIGGIYELRNGKVLCHVFAGGQRVATFEPQCGGPWAKVIGEERYFAFANGLDKIVSWPFREGRTSVTTSLIVLLGILCASIMGRREIWNRSPARHGESRLSLRLPIWQQALSSFLIVALVLATTPVHAQASQSDPLFHYNHNDHLGSSSVLTNRAGQRVQHYGYSADGNATYTVSGNGDWTLE
jgi:hypothetical protein